MGRPGALERSLSSARRHLTACTGAVLQDSFFTFRVMLLGGGDMELNKMINRRTNMEQMLGIFRIGFLLENRRQFYSAETSEQNIF